jgi:hypothetical protein
MFNLLRGFAFYATKISCQDRCLIKCSLAIGRATLDGLSARQPPEQAFFLTDFVAVPRAAIGPTRTLPQRRVMSGFRGKPEAPLQCSECALLIQSGSERLTTLVATFLGL